MDRESAQSQGNWSGEQVAKNRLTGLYPPAGFMEEARPFIAQAVSGKYCMVAVDIRHFRLFNKFHGRTAGDKLLRYIADCLETRARQYGGVAGYFEGDNFCVVMPWDMELVGQLWEDIRAGVDLLGGAVGVIPAFGIAPLMISNSRRRCTMTGRLWLSPMWPAATTLLSMIPEWRIISKRKCGC